MLTTKGSSCIGYDKNDISFLDVRLMIEERKIIFDIFKKPGRYLNLNSNHPIEHKKGVIKRQFDRIIFLFHPKFQEKRYIP